MSLSLRTFYLLLFFSCICLNTFAQDRATITGVVSDQYGILPGAKLSIEGTNYKTTTDVNGIYTFKLEEGDYIIAAEFVMYESKTNSVNVKVGETVTLDFLLETGFSIDEPVFFRI